MSFTEPSDVPPATPCDFDSRVVPGALIVGGAHVSIAIARSLGRRGIPVWLLTDHPLAKLSRYVRRSLSWPGAGHESAVASIVDLAVGHGLKGWVLVATGDEDMRIIALNHALLSSHYRVMTPDWDTTKWVYDKRLTYQRAASLGISCAWNFKPWCLESVQQLKCQFPVVLKPAVRNGLNDFTRAKAWRAENRDDLLSLYQRAAALVGKEGVIIQEWIPGNGETQYSYAGLWNQGEAVASLVARRRRQYPVDFGRSSTFVETVEQPEVEILARRLLKSLNYSGVVEIEFKYDQRDRQYKLLDVNGRFWTWNGLGSRAGVDFPYLAWRQALGWTVPSAHAETGVAWLHASRDILAAFAEIWRGELSVKDYLAGLRRRLVFANFAIDDPLPALGEFPVLAWKTIAGKLHRLHP